MADELTARVAKEQVRLKRRMRDMGMDDARVKLLQPVIENTAWMCIKLEDARVEIQDADVVIPYDNGGGQSGIRQNPAFQGYEALWKSYLAGMTQLLSAPATKDAKVEQLKPASVIALVKNRRELA